MSLKQELDTINIATQKLLYDCNEVISEHLPAAETLAELPTKIGDMYGVGYTAGNDGGFATGQKIGHDSGYEEGYAAGKAEGGGDYDTGYAAGYEAGMGEGIEVGRANGIEDGKAEAYHAFWDAYQDGGRRTVYRHAFAGEGWTDSTFKPQYAIAPTNAYMMFYFCRASGDLDKHLADLGITLDFSCCTDCSYLFYQCGFTAVGTVDCSGCTGDQPSLFNSPNLTTIREFIPPDVEMRMTWFSTGLKYLTMGGAITKTANFSRCPLSRGSIESVMAALSDTVTGQTATFNKTAVDAAFTAEEWAALVASKPNWTVTLA